MHRARFLLLSCAVLSLAPTFAAGHGAAPASRPGFDGIWNSATVTPLERPVQLKDKAFFTPEEAAAFERQTVESNQEPSPEAASKSRGTGTYNTFYREFASRTVATLRTSIVTDPPDGRIPALTPAAAEVKRRRVDAMKNAASAEDTGLQDQCLAFVTAGPPMLPYSYNSNYQIVQARDAVVVHAEMLHDARIIRTDGRPHVSPVIRRGWAIRSAIGPKNIRRRYDELQRRRRLFRDAGGNPDGTEFTCRAASLLEANTLRCSRSTIRRPSPAVEG